MKTKETTGWVVAALPHPTSGKDMIVEYSFAYSRREAIQNFMCQENYKRKDWDRWKKQFNFKCVKAKSTITILEKY